MSLTHTNHRPRNKSCKIHQDGKNVTKQCKSLVVFSTDIRSTLEPGTQRTLFNWKKLLNWIEPVIVILAISLLGKETGAKKGFLSTFINDVGEEVIWWVAPLSSIQQLWATGNKPEICLKTEVATTLACGVTGLEVKTLSIWTYWSLVKLGRETWSS
jgi:hypothetical protein